MLVLMFITSIVTIYTMGLMYLVCDLLEFRNLLKKPYRKALGEIIAREYHHNRYSTSVSYTIKFWDIHENELTRTTENYIMGEENPEVFREHEKVEIVYFEDCNYIFFSRIDLQNQVKNKLYNIIGLVSATIIFIVIFVIVSI